MLARPLPAPVPVPPSAVLRMCSSSTKTSSTAPRVTGNIPTDVPANWSISKVVTMSSQPSICICVPANTSRLRLVSMRTKAVLVATGFKISAISGAPMYWSGTMTLEKPVPAPLAFWKLGAILPAFCAPLMNKRSLGPRTISAPLL